MNQYLKQRPSSAGILMSSHQGRFYGVSRLEVLVHMITILYNPSILFTFKTNEPPYPNTRSLHHA